MRVANLPKAGPMMLATDTSGPPSGVTATYSTACTPRTDVPRRLGAHASLRIHTGIVPNQSSEKGAPNHADRP
jgi:hypothetical protein